MQNLEENQVLKDAAHKYGQLLDEAHQREAQAIDLAEKKIHEARLSKIETEEIKNKLVESTIKNSNLEEKNNYLEKEVIRIEKSIASIEIKTLNKNDSLNLEDELKLLSIPTPSSSNTFNAPLLHKKGSSCINSDFKKMENEETETCKFCCIF